MRHILNTTQFSKADIEKILSEVPEMEKICRGGSGDKPLEGKVVACVFFEPSTRTRLSFETAALRLGAGVISAEDALANSSVHKGETIEDTVQTLSCYADAIVMRHPEAGSAEKASRVATKPLVNAGDGANQHPSQGLLDLYTIKKEHGRLDNISIAFVGDVLNSRTLRSLVPLLLLYPDNKFYFISPKELALPEEYRKYLIDHKAKFEEINTLDDTLPKVDVLYMTRVQKERFQNPADYERVKDFFLLKPEHVQKLKKDAIIMHPLPRVNEIDPEIDKDSRAAYFRQAQNGLYVRMALLCYALGL
ncbi:MAG TPA: aspartate carbamoyltransferase [Candidatus Paceibacterota bacterium]|nr:aspartate carbamoyltransferase [Candidatus Paceibacterota bacterium]